MLVVEKSVSNHHTTLDDEVSLLLSSLNRELGVGASCLSIGVFTVHPPVITNPIVVVIVFSRLVQIKVRPCALMPKLGDELDLARIRDKDGQGKN